MNVIIINGQRIEVPSDSSVSIINGEVRVGGVTLKSGLSGIVKVEWSGPLAHLRTDASVTCGKVDGDVSAGGSVTCEAVGGSVSAGGSVRCSKVTGPVSAGGSVRMS